MSLSVTALLHAALAAAPATTVLVDGRPTPLAEVERASRTARAGVLGDLAAARTGRPLGTAPAVDVEAAEASVWSGTALADGPGAWTHGDLLAVLGTGADVPERLRPLADLLVEVQLAGAWSRAVDVHRDEDDELVGRLVPTATGWLPVTLLGTRLGPAQDPDAATYGVLAAGLSWLAEPWELWLDDGWVTVTVGEVTPTTAVVRLADYGHPDRYGEARTLALPVGASLRPR